MSAFTLTEQFTPKFLSALREGYRAQYLRADALSGLTVAIVALPLSMAIAIASGAKPEQGLFTAIVGGFVISALGGSRFQIGGPAGAFIVVVAATIERHGYDGMLLATIMAGAMLAIAGWLRLGTYIKYVPHPVTVGFTAGIAMIIFASQIKDMLGLTLTGKEPGAFLPKLEALWQALPSLNPSAIGITGLAVALIIGIKRWRPHWPNLLIAVAATSLLAWYLQLPVETIHSRFGAIPNTLPLPALPPLSAGKLIAVLPDALTFALLGGIESLLSAVVADSMSGRRHRSNAELVAQGIANIGSGLFGGLVATGTIARTATNIRAGAHGPVSGMLHSLFLLVFMFVAAPLAGYIPLAALGGILAVVSWNMAEKAAFWTLLKDWRGEAIVLLATFLLTLFIDLTTGIIVGVALGCLIFMHRMARETEITSHKHSLSDDSVDTDPDIIVHRISGAFFFGAAGAVSAVLDRIGEKPRAYVLDLAEVPFIDSSAAHVLHSFLVKAKRQHVEVYLTGATQHVLRELIKFGIKKPAVHYASSVEACIATIRSSA